MTAPGGFDIQLKWVPTPDQMLDRVKALWPNAVEADLGGHAEVLYYENVGARQDWAKNGATAENADTMVHAVWIKSGAECWLVVGSLNGTPAKHLLSEGWRPNDHDKT